jgi:hypothetical protein
MRRHLKTCVLVVAVLIVAALGFFSADAQQNGVRGQAPGVNRLTQNFLAEHEIGRRFHFEPADLPPPKTGAIVTDRSLIVPYSGQVPQVPPGFTATPFATGLVNPRRLLVLPNGDVLVAEQSAGYLTLLRDDGSGYATWIDRHVEDLNKPYGLAWRDNHVLVIKTASGACHTISALFALAAMRQSASIKYRLTNVSRRRAPTALR